MYQGWPFLNSVHAYCTTKSEGRFVSYQEMDFEKEMQKALRVIYQNIQVLEENRDKTPTASMNDRDLSVKRRPRKLSMAVQRAAQPKSVGQATNSGTLRKQRGFTV